MAALNLITISGKVRGSAGTSSQGAQPGVTPLQGFTFDGPEFGRPGARRGC
jgi:hypothetical protein